MQSTLIMMTRPKKVILITEEHRPRPMHFLGSLCNNVDVSSHILKLYFRVCILNNYIKALCNLLVELASQLIFLSNNDQLFVHAFRARFEISSCMVQNGGSRFFFDVSIIIFCRPIKI